MFFKSRREERQLTKRALVNIQNDLDSIRRSLLELVLIIGVESSNPVIKQDCLLRIQQFNALIREKLNRYERMQKEGWDSF